MSEWQRIGAPWRCRPSRDVQRLLDVFLTLDSVKKKVHSINNISGFIE